MKKTVLREYARLIVKMGINVQKGQDVIIRADLDQPEFVYTVAEECYRQGAAKVTVDWSYQPLTKLNTRHMSLKKMSKYEDWEVARLAHNRDTLPAVIYLDSEDPDGLKGVNQEKLSKAMQEKFKVSKPYRDEMDNKYQWCIAAVPGRAWAKKLFPHLRASVAEERLWEAILKASRADKDPIDAWKQHNSDLDKKCRKLNSLGLESITFSASNGTNLRIGLIDDALFLAGAEKTLQGVVFNPNIPSEEVFTSPMKGKAEGIAYASKPLSYQGQLIEDFWVKFEDGKAVDCGAKTNEKLLRKMIAMDEGAAYLGECALVPYDSPISRSEMLFLNTLFDENAACHIALGRGFNNCLKDFEKYSFEECVEKGINDSAIHVDFMIGTKDMNITGKTKDGKQVSIFKKGNWDI